MTATNGPPLPEITGQRIIGRSRFFAIEELNLRFSNGATRTYERLRKGGREAVLIVPIDANGDLLLIREYMAGLHDYEWSFPKGGVDSGEGLEEAANRELKEEVGFGARSITRLRHVSLAPAQMGYGIHILLAQDLYPERVVGDEPEPFEVVRWPLEKLDELVMHQNFSESRSIAALKIVEIHLAEAKQ